MPTPTRQIEIWRDRLLDMSRRNRLLHLRPDQPGVIALAQPPAAELYELLVRRGRTLEFAQTLTIAQQLAALGWEAPATGATIRLDRLAAQAAPPGQLASDREPAEQERALYNLRLRARAALSEQGVNLLYVALGFLEWLPPAAGEGYWRSPLLLLPAELRRDTFGAGYRLRLADDEVTLNPTLALKLRRECGLALPELPEDPDDLALEPWLEQVGALIAEREGWQITREAALGTFSFLKLLMYHDLERAAGLAEQHPILGRLADGDKLRIESAEWRIENVDRASSPFSILHPPFSLDARPPEECFQVLDADASQAAAIAAARAGASFVLHGPPGTGKSQTIANIIAELLADGKRVLFVSEKQAALQVVYQRLAQCGLDTACLELHSHKAARRAVIDALGVALLADPPPAAPNFPYAELAALRDRLNRYCQALHQPDAALGWTPFEVQARLGQLHDAPDLAAPLGDLAAYAAERLAAIDALLARLDARSALLQSLPANVWRGCAIDVGSFEQRGRVRAQLRAFQAALAELMQQAARYAAQLELPPPTTVAAARGLAALAGLLRAPQRAAAAWLADADAAARCAALIDGAAPRYAALLADEARLLARYDERLLELDLATLRERFYGQYAGGLRVLRPQFHRDLAALRTRARPGAELAATTVAGDLDLALAVQAGRAWEQAHAPELVAQLGAAFTGRTTDWDALRAAAAWAARLLAIQQPLPAPLLALAEQPPAQRAAPDDAGLLAALARLDEQLAFVAGLALEQEALAPAQLEASASEAVSAHTATLLDRMGDLDAWWEYCELRRAAEPLGMADLLDALSRDLAAAAQPRRAFHRRLCRDWLAQAYAREPLLGEFDVAAYEAQVERFRTLDREQLAAARLRLRQRLAERRPGRDTPAPRGSELGTLRRELEKQRQHKPIRRLLAEIPDLLGRLKPCLLMSPLSVSQFLDPALPPFDLVVFDEASQVRSEDAIGAIMRGRALIVVGDNRQLPPTSFFLTGAAGLEEEAEEEPGAGDESILDAASAAGLPSRLLRWHYRSRDEALITFSNSHFYDAQLATFPSAAAAEGRGISLEHVPAGVYERQTSRANPAEARRVAELVVAHWRTRPAQSLGVVTFSESQQLAVLHELERRCAADAALAELLDEQRPEALFVKNLEHVQGDERDVMIISVGYGPDAGGRVLMQFGPLTHRGGERRLNVAITRARDQVIVVSSLLPEQIDLRRVQHPGPRLLRAYLEYAQRGGPAPTLPTPPPARRADPAGQPPLAPARFEDRLAVALARRGLLLARQVGHSAFRIDIAVRDPRDPQRFELGIECDGDDYRSAPTARDRERLREELLGSLGWRIHRAWSAAWAHDPEAEIARVLAAVETARG